MKKELTLGSNKSFGIVFFIFFALIESYLFYKSNIISYKLISLSLIFLILGLLNSKILTPLNILWFKFGILLSKIISPIIIALIFFLVVTPLALLAKIVKKDFLDLDKGKIKRTYWVKKDEYKSSMKDQF